MSVHFAWNPCSPCPESMFMIPGIRVHDALESLFTFEWNPRSRCRGIPTGTHVGANLVPKLPRQRRNNGDVCYPFFESFVSVSLGSCSLVFN